MSSSNVKQTKIESNQDFLKQSRGTKAFAGHSAIRAMGYWAPETICTAKDIESRITTGLSGLDLEELLGMAEKRVSSGSPRLLEMSMNAIDNLLANGTLEGNPIDLQQIDLVIYFGISTELVEPATALLVANQLGLEGVIGFDVSDACLGFTDAWMIADSMIGMGRIRNALLVSAERNSSYSELAIEAINKGEPLRDHYAALSLGDGACAVLIGPHNSEHRSVTLLAGARQSFSEFCDLCVIPSERDPMITQSSKLLGSASSNFPPVFYSVMEHVNWSMEQIDFYVAHQASLPAIQAASHTLNVPFSKSRNSIDKFGNMASVSVPFTLAKALEEMPYWEGQKIIQLAFGSGLGIGVFALECT